MGLEEIKSCWLIGWQAGWLVDLLARSAGSIHPSIYLSAISVGESLVLGLLHVSGLEEFNESSQLHLALWHELALVAQVPAVCVGGGALAKSVRHGASFAVSVAHASAISVLHALLRL